ncbi:hypothetical protein GCM10020221_06410 [Streptomyces thioluteus]|uniref:Uncharacterized protein n=1 Tax=Streptomyces thioluteus TaxID=66431 RepID=A0ABP6IXY7_STRTU
MLTRCSPSRPTATFFDGCGFPTPGLHSFVFEPLFKIGGIEVNKPMLLAVLSSVVVLVFLWAALRPRQGGAGQAPDGR